MLFFLKMLHENLLITHTISALALIVFIILTLWGISDFSLTKIFVGIVGFGVSLFINVFSDDEHYIFTNDDTNPA